MRHTLIRVFIHVVFSTKNRRNTIHKSFREKLWSYMGGIASSMQSWLAVWATMLIS